MNPTRRVRRAQIAYIKKKKKKNASTHGSRRGEHASLFSRGEKARRRAISKSHETTERSGRPLDGGRSSPRKRGAAAVAANISSSCCTAGDRGRAPKGPGITKTTYIFSTQFQTLKGKRDPRLGPASIIPSTNTMLGGGSPPSPRLPSCTRPCREYEVSRGDTSAREHVLLNYARVTAPRETEVRGASQPENYARRLIRCAPSGPRGVKRNLNWGT